MTRSGFLYHSVRGTYLMTPKGKLLSYTKGTKFSRKVCYEKSQKSKKKRKANKCAPKRRKVRRCAPKSHKKVKRNAKPTNVPLKDGKLKNAPLKDEKLKETDVESNFFTKLTLLLTSILCNDPKMSNKNLKSSKK